jgi:hypothetical protein
MEITEAGMDTLLRLPHPENAPASMEVTEVGMATLLRLKHIENALSPMDITESGMDTLLRLSHPENAFSPMAATGSLLILSGMTSWAAEPVYLVMITPRDEPEPTSL